jgi:hypothetical protein
MRAWGGMVLAVVLAGCGTTELSFVDGGVDAPIEPGADAAPDAPVDSGASDDAPVDSGGSADAALDARASDDAALDAASDARTDASADARSPDAGAPDAGAPDARTPGEPDPRLVEICGAMPVTLDDWEDCYQHRACEWQVNCVTLNTYRDVAECIALGDDVEGGRLAAERRDRARAVAEGRAAIDIEAFTSCLLATSGAHCNTALYDVACLTRFAGTVADDAACYTDVDCASPGAVCQRDCDDACCTGTCRRKFREGETCDERRSCEPGMQCHRICYTGDVGTHCTSDRQCDADAWCDPQTGRCEADYAPNAACTNLLQCGGETMCVGLTIPGGQSGRCLRITEPGDRCDSWCYGNLYCDGGGRCRQMPATGAPCSALVPCGSAANVCVEGRCVAAGAAGDRCDGATCGPGLFCTSELGDADPRCAAPRDPGRPCSDPSHCSSYLCTADDGQSGVCVSWSDECPLGGA